MSQSHLFRRLGPCVLTVALAGAAAAQGVIVVDPAGGGDCRTIAHAIAVARTGDEIRVHKGTYRDALVLDGKAVTILGAGAANEVVIAVGRGPAVLVRNHPAGRRTTLARLTVNGRIHAASSRGELVLDAVTGTGGCSVADYRGTVSFNDCTIDADRESLVATSVANLFCHGTRFRSIAPNAYGTCNTVTVQDSSAHFAACSIHGASGSAVRGTPGGTALLLLGAQVRISGSSAHAIHGGAGVRGGGTTSLGGVGIFLRRSALWVTGVTVRGGEGELFGRVLRAPAIRRGDRASTVHTPAQAMPYLSLREVSGRPVLSRGSNTRVEVQASAGALSVTFLGLATRPFASPWGIVALDFAQPIWSVPRTHDGSGRAAFDLDLRTAGAGDVGIPFAIQTVAMATGGQVQLSGPRLGVVSM